MRMAERLARKDGISLKAVCAWVVTGVLVISAITWYSTISLSAAFEQLADATEDLITLGNAARELMDASDYLTERVQRFTVNGDRRFMDEYFVEVYETGRREAAIRKLSDDPAYVTALEQLQVAHGESVELMGREYYAMRLVADANGMGDLPDEVASVKLSDEDLALAPDEKMRRASEMVMGDEYYEQKDLIRASMIESLGELESLARGTESQATDDLRSANRLVRIVTTIRILGVFLIALLAIRLVITPVLGATESIKLDEPIKESGSREFRYLAAAYNRLFDRLSEENKRLRSVSRTDSLTKINNRTALRNDYDLYQGHEVTVLLLDLDEFKMINDTFGHKEGDRVLKETGALLSDTFGQERCYRYGGDEFLVIVPDEPEEEFVESLERVMAGRPYLESDGERRQVGYSIGYVHATLDDTRALRDLFSEADQRMYQVKRKKKEVKQEAMERETAGAHLEAAPAGEEYTTGEMRLMLDNASGMYDMARVVDPIECRVLEIGDDGSLHFAHRCYGIWNADQKCVNCTSTIACRTRRPQAKEELFDGRLFHIQSSPVRLRLPDGAPYEAVVELVSVRDEDETATFANDRAAENVNDRAAQYHAWHDRLTKTLNPEPFSELAREAINASPNASWVMVTSNVCDFGLINTLFGVQRANEALVTNASLLQGVAQRAGGLCARLAGDQFAVLMPAVSYSKDRLLEVSRDLMDRLSTGIYTFRVQFGVYEVADPSIPVSVMCDRANMALSSIRGSLGRTIAVFDDQMMERSLLEHEVVSGFEAALSAGQFEMYLQPVVDQDGHVLGAEALARWRRADGTVVMPDDFVWTLERAGLIHRLDAYMWERAIAQLVRWQNTPLAGLTISVNVSAKDFFSIDVFETITELQGRYGVRSDLIKLEITETALIEELGRGDAVLQRLRAHGFLVAIDDFGKDNSSLDLLKDVQADVLKIDVSLVREIEENPRSRTIVAWTIGMADALGMSVVTEGVETYRQLASLVAMGCRQFQGYHFSHAVTVEEFEALCGVEPTGGKR